MIVECRGICKSFGGVRALDGVSFDFPSQRITAVIGRNGAGKTTLIDTLTGLARPDEGQWILDGTDVTGFSTARMVKLGVARSFQGLRLLGCENLLDNVGLAIPDDRSETLRAAVLRRGRSKNEAAIREVALALLRKVGLDKRWDAPVSSLSYGEQKLLSLVVTSATGAGLLLLDEPVAGVHGADVDVILSLVKGLKQSGRTVIVVEHDMVVVSQLADTVVVMDRGRILGIGPPAEILSRRDLMEDYLG